MAHLSLGVLGPLQVLIDGALVTALESDKTRALLVYLAVEGDRPHRRESLVGLLWPDCPEQVARHNLRQALFSLRQAIGDHAAVPPYLLISREAIQINRASDFSLDLTQFSDILRACEQDRKRGIEDPSVRAARLEDMVKLYRGEFLQGFFLDDSDEFENWTLIQRESVHRRVLEACTYLADYHERHGDFETARRHASRQLELDPWREEAHRQMMRALALDGQRSAALAQYETCRRLLAEELGVEPSANTRELVEQIRAGALKLEERGPSFIATGPVYNLPVSLTSFVGREQELADLDRLIANPECRCMSLVGPGGIGKTRLALQAAAQHRADFAHGVAFIPLAPVDSVRTAVTAIASAIRLSFYGPNDPKEQLFHTLGEKQMLLILDNVEHLLAGEPPQASIAKLVLGILERAPGVKLLVTSREVLNLQEEWVYEVRGLAFPDQGARAGLDEYAAVALFAQRGRRAWPGFAPGEAELAGIARICRLVEGMPLAIELAATWLRTLSPAEIAQEIEGSLEALSASLRDLPERHRSMRVVFEHSWQRLSAKERAVLAQLSVFRGGFSRQAAEQVAGASLPVLSTLVNRTLLRRVEAGRYGLHVLVRQYAATRLEADPEEHPAAQQRHYSYFLALAEAAGQELKGRNQLEWLGRLEQEHDNLRAALEWALEADQTAGGDGLATRLSGALLWFWRMRGRFHEGCTWLTTSLQQGPHKRTATRAAARLGQSQLLCDLGDLDAARQAAEESAAIYRELGDERGLAEVLSVLEFALTWQAEPGPALARLEELLAACRKAGDRWGEARALYKLGNLLTDSSGDPSGRAMFEESAAILEDLGERWFLTGVQTYLGIVDMRLGDYAGARARFERGLVLAREIDDPVAIADALMGLGRVNQLLGEWSTAESCLEQAQRVYHEHGCRVWETVVLCGLVDNAISQGGLATARSHLRRASGCLGRSENKWLETLVRYCSGVLVYYEGDAVAAMTLLEEATALAREGQDKSDLVRSLIALGRVQRTLGQSAPASELLMEGLELSRALGHKPGMASALEELGALSAVQGDGVHAAMLFGTAHALREEMGAPLPPVDRPAYDSAVAACRDLLGEAAFAEAWAGVADRPYQEVVEEALKRR